jgi:hypothetical protein
VNAQGVVVMSLLTTFEFKSVKNPKGIKVIYEVTQEELDAAMRKVHKLKNNEK